MRKSYRAWTPKQVFLLPPSPHDWLPSDHLVYFMLEVINELDLSEIEAAIQAKDARGTRSYSPYMMTAVLLFAYCTGVFSSRKIARATYEQVTFRVLAGGEHPFFTTINQFRLVHRNALGKLFVQVLELCRKAGLVTLGHVSLDGSKVEANASKHKAMSYQRMNESEKRLQAEIEALLAQADAIDAKEDELYGPGQDIHDLPEELRHRETRIARIRQAKAELEREAALARADELDNNAKGQEQRSVDELRDEVERKRAATRAGNSRQRAHKLRGGDDDDEPPRLFPDLPEDLPRNRVPHTPEGRPKPKAQRNFTDPESRIMEKNNNFMQAYNVQVAVDAEHQVIVAAALSNQAPDQEHLPPMVDRIIDNCGQAPRILSADSGYFSTDNVSYCEQRSIDAHIAVGRRNDTPDDGPAQPTAATQAKECMRLKLTSEDGRATYARRKAIVEPALGQIKHAQGFRRFSLRGLAKVSPEWLLVCTTHNLLKLFRYREPAAALC